jgi:GT2 family glycosyltransferase
MSYTSLQSLIWPEIGLCTERDLYVRLEGGTAMSLTDREMHFPRGGWAGFGSYNNLFNIGKWVKQCGLETLSLRLAGAGRFELAIFLAQPERSWERLSNEIVTLDLDAPLVLPVEGLSGIGTRGAVFFELRALDQAGGVLRAADWCTEDSPRRTPELMLSITTFRREAAVARTADRFERFIAGSALKDHIRMVVVDNGQSAEIPPSDHVTLIPNENLGGSGGFARGLLEARARGASHCLFMDDDAAVHMEALERTWRFLAYATDPATAVAGAVANAQHRWAVWENGALFHQSCKPQFIGTDLRDPGQVLEMEFSTTATAPDNFYGGWWYFAFPVDEVRLMPFPFFVRGDDVSFGLAQDFNIVTLPGVMSFQDDNFANKESLQTLYLDLRSHLAHHMALPHMEIGRLRTLAIAGWFFARSLFQCHYETLAALTLSLDDFMAGPDFFAGNADMAQRRADIAALRDDEAWKDGTAPPRAPRRRINPDRWLWRQAMILSANGHLLPFFRHWGDRVVLDAGQRGQLHQIWGAAEITYVDETNGKHFTMRHSKLRAARQVWRFAKSAWRFWRDYDALKRIWQEGYPQLASEYFWRDRLGMPSPDRPAAPKKRSA